MAQENTMTARLPILKPKEVIKALQRAGFYITRQSGSHARLLHETHAQLRVTVPIHNKDIGIRLLKRILGQANLTSDEFQKFI